MEPRFETLTMRHILEGLNHNLNTPLNLILGYAQHLQGSYPGDPYLQKIIDAGLKIDHQLSNLMQAVHARLFQETESFELDVWLQRELSFLYCDLKIKRSVVFEQNSIPAQLMVRNSRSLLSLAFETIIYSIMELNPESATRIALTLLRGSQEITLKLSFPALIDYSPEDVKEITIKRLSESLNSWGKSDWDSFIGIEAGTAPDSLGIDLNLVIRQMHD